MMDTVYGNGLPKGTQVGKKTLETNVFDKKNGDKSLSLPLSLFLSLPNSS